MLEMRQKEMSSTGLTITNSLYLEERAKQQNGTTNNMGQK
jgi:hypothetical protein